MDIRSWLLCYPIKWMLEGLAKELASPSPGMRWRTFLINDGPNWTFKVAEPFCPILQIVQSSGPREGRIIVTFGVGPLAGKSYHISRRHPAHAAVFRLTAAHRAVQADADGLN